MRGVESGGGARGWDEMTRGSVTGTGRASTLCEAGGIPHLPGSRPRGWSSVLGGGGAQRQFWHIRQKLHCGCYLCVPPATLGYDLWRRDMSALSRPRMPAELASEYPVQRQWLPGSPGGGPRVRLTDVSSGGRLLAQLCRNWAHQARDKLLFYRLAEGLQHRPRGGVPICCRWYTLHLGDSPRGADTQAARQHG